MKIGLDVSPLENTSMLTHRVRGTGFYIENLKKYLFKYYPQNEYIFFTKEQNLPSDLDLIHYPYFEPFFLTLPLHKRHKTVVTVHDLTPLVFSRYFPAGIKGTINWQIQKFALNRVDGIITDSESSKNDITKYANVPYAKISTVYLAASSAFKVIRDHKLLENIKVRYNLPGKFVLYVGDVTWNKNLPRLVQAIKKINVNLVMVGKALVKKDFDRKNPWNQDLVKVQKLANDDKRIIRLGFVPTKDLISIYNLATVFVMPSLYEGFGLPVLEAMQCGCPVITTKEGSLFEVAGDAALYVDAYDVLGITGGIKRVFADGPLRRELSEKALQQAKKFSWKMTINRTMQVYKEVYEKNH